MRAILVFAMIAAVIALPSASAIKVDSVCYIKDNGVCVVSDDDVCVDNWQRCGDQCTAKVFGLEINCFG